jgi:hypothetical protein
MGCKAVSPRKRGEKVRKGDLACGARAITLATGEGRGDETCGPVSKGSERVKHARQAPRVSRAPNFLDAKPHISRAAPCVAKVISGANAPLNGGL